MYNFDFSIFQLTRFVSSTFHEGSDEECDADCGESSGLSGSASVTDRDVSAPSSSRPLLVNSTSRKRKSQSADLIDLKIIEMLQKDKRSAVPEFS